MIRLAIVIPCYNEQETLPHTLEVISGCLESMTARGLIASDSYIMCVDDGSKDSTWDIISAHHARDNRIKGLLLAHNRGQQFALIAGMEAVTDRCDACVTMDADLQDDPGALPRMVEEFDKGAEIVFGVRSSRKRDSWAKRTTALSYYRVQRSLGLETVGNHAEYRLMSNRALHMLSAYGERNIYLRGIIAQLGLKTAIVTYPRAERTAGESKYSYRKLFSLAAEGIISFSAKPITWILRLGISLMILSIAIAVWALISYMSGYAISGWTSLILSVWFLGSLILISIGIVGQYIGKIYIESKQRPRYAVETELFD